MASFLDSFSLLTHVEPGKRETGAAALRAHLTAHQSQFEAATAAKTGVAAPAVASAVITPAAAVAEGATVSPICCADVDYAVTRLARGVASSNGAARQGFAAGLADVLITFPRAVATLPALARLLKHTRVSGKSSRLEQRDALLGRVFGLMAFVRADRVAGLVGVDAAAFAPLLVAGDVTTHTTRDGGDASDAGSDGGGEDAGSDRGFGSDDDDADGDVAMGEAATPPHRSAADGAMDGQGTLLSALLVDTLLRARQKSWLTDLAYEAVVGLVTAAGKEAWLRGDTRGAVAAALAHPCRAWTSEQLSLALAVEELVAQRWFAGQAVMLPDAVVRMRQALERDALLRYRAMRRGARGGDGGDEDDGDSDGEAPAAPTTLPVAAAPFSPALGGSAKSYPQVHTVWARLMSRYSETALAPRPEMHPKTRDGVATGEIADALAAGVPADVAAFTEMWRVYVDELLMGQGVAKKATAFALLHRVLPAAAKAHPAVLAGVLSSRQVASIVRNVSRSRNYLASSCAAVLDTLVAVSQDDPECAAAAVVALLARGHPDFDKRTRTRTVAALLTQLEPAAVLRHLVAAQREFAQPSDAPVYSDIASTATGLIEAADAERNAALQSSRRPRSSSVDDGGGSEAGAGSVADGEEDDEAREAELLKHVLSPAEKRRLWGLNTIINTLKNPSLASMRHPTIVRNIVTFLAFHACGGVEADEDAMTQLVAAAAASASAGTAAASGKGSARKPRASAADKDKAQLAELLRSLVPLCPTADAGVSIADGKVEATAGIGSSALTAATLALMSPNPPLSPQLRQELRTRLPFFIRDIVALSHATGRREEADDAAPATAAVAAAAAAAATAAAASAPARPAPAQQWWHGLRDHAVAVSVATAELSGAVNRAWSALADAADKLAERSEAGGDLPITLQVAVSPTRAQLDAEAPRDDDSEGDEGDDAEGDDDEASGGGDESAPAARAAASDDDDAAAGSEGSEGAASHTPPTHDIHARASAAAAALTSLARAASEAASAEYGHIAAAPAAPATANWKAVTSVVQDCARGLAAVGAMLSVTTMQLLGEAVDKGDARDSAVAVEDALRAGVGLLARLIDALAASLTAATAAGAAPSAATAPTPSKRGAGKARGKGAAAGSGDAASASPHALHWDAARLATTAAELAAGVTALLPAEEGAAQHHSAVELLHVFVDSCMAVLSSGSGMAREVVAVAARFAFIWLDDEAVETLLAVVLEKLPQGGSGEGEEDGDSDDDDGGDDDDGEDDGGAGDAPAAKRARTSGADGEEVAAAGGEGGDDDDAATTGASTTGGAGAAGQMAAYDRMLATMVRERMDVTRTTRRLRQQALAFKYRALDLVEEAVATLTSMRPSHVLAAAAEMAAEAASAAAATAVPLAALTSLNHVASPRVACMLLPLLAAARKLASRAKPSSDSVAARLAAENAKRLLHRITTSLSGVCRSRLHLAPLTTAAAAALPPLRLATVIDAEALLQVFEVVMHAVESATTTEYVAAAALVNGLILRTLRLTAPLPAGASVATAAPIVRLVDALAPRYAHALMTMLTGKGNRINGAFITAATAAPAVTARLLPTAIAALASGEQPLKPYKVAEALELATALARAAIAPAVASHPAALLRADDEVVVVESEEAPAEAVMVSSVSDYMTRIGPSAATALADLLRRATAADSGLGGKHARLALVLLRVLANAASGGLARDESEAILEAVAAAAASFAKTDGVTAAAEAVRRALGTAAAAPTPSAAPAPLAATVASASKTSKRSRAPAAPTPAAAAATAPAATAGGDGDGDEEMADFAAEGVAAAQAKLAALLAVRQKRQAAEAAAAGALIAVATAALEPEPAPTPAPAPAPAPAEKPVAGSKRRRAASSGDGHA